MRLLAKADDPASLAPVVERRPLSRAANELLIEVKAAAVNPSDVKAATGLMAYAVFPRTPGRDYAGVVIDGPAGWIGREVFGSSGDLAVDIKAKDPECPIKGVPSIRFDMRLSRETAADRAGGRVGADPSAILKQPA